MPTRPSCGKELSGEFAFCPFCGAELDDKLRSRVHEERKIVTVLFCNLVGPHRAGAGCAREYRNRTRKRG